MTSLEVLLLCPAGFEKIVRMAIARDFADYCEADVSSGYLRCFVSAEKETLATLPYATNVFDLIAKAPRSDLREDLSALSKALIRRHRPRGLPRRNAFRLRLFDDGRFVTTSSPEAAHLITTLASWSGLRHEPRGGQVEFWVIRRRTSRQTALGTKLGGGRSQSPRGSLRPEIAAALARAIPLHATDTVLDPFAGSGAIGIAALGAGAGRVWLNDIARDSMALMRRLRDTDRERVHQSHLDFRLLANEDGPYVSAVITDPPWGLFKDTNAPIDRLYADLATVMARILETGRPMIVLTGAPPPADSSLTKSGFFTHVQTIPVLVNGKKARVVSTRRTKRRPV